jgi:hypothetical protein
MYITSLRRSTLLHCNGLLSVQVIDGIHHHARADCNQQDVFAPRI